MCAASPCGRPAAVHDGLAPEREACLGNAALSIVCLHGERVAVTRENAMQCAYFLGILEDMQTAHECGLRGGGGDGGVGGDLYEWQYEQQQWEQRGLRIVARCTRSTLTPSAFSLKDFQKVPKLLPTLPGLFFPTVSGQFFPTLGALLAQLFLHSAPLHMVPFGLR